MAASLAPRHNHSPPNPRLRPPLPPRSQERNRLSRNPSREWLAHTNQAQPARHICVANRSEKYRSPHRSHVAEIFEIFPRESAKQQNGATETAGYAVLGAETVMTEYLTAALSFILVMLPLGLLRRQPRKHSDLRAVRHAELAHDLPNMKFDGTVTHRQPARNDLVRIAIAQKFEDRSLPRC